MGLITGKQDQKIAAFGSSYAVKHPRNQVGWPAAIASRSEQAHSFFASITALCFDADFVGAAVRRFDLPAKTSVAPRRRSFSEDAIEQPLDSHTTHALEELGHARRVFGEGFQVLEMLDTRGVLEDLCQLTATRLQ